MLRFTPRFAATLAAVVLACGLRAADDGPRFVAVPAERSGLAHGLNSDPKLGKIETPYVGALVDIDGDGKLDVVWYGHSGGGAATFLGKGDGKFEFDGRPYKQWFTWHAFAPMWWAISDKRTVAVGSHGTAGVFARDVAGQWKKVSDLGFDQLIDGDGDGRHDEIWREGEVNTLSPGLREWNGEVPAKLKVSPAWKAEDVVGWPAAEKRNPHPLGPRFHRCYSVDLDGSDKNSLVVTFRGTALYSWVLDRDPAAKGRGGWKDATERRGLPTGPGHYFLPEDVNVDGALDLLDLASGEWYVNDGKGKFAKAPTRIFDPKTRKGGAPWSADGRLELLDLTNSGRRDLVLCSFHGTDRGLFRNHADGKGGAKFTEPATEFPLARVAQAFGDVDGDGDLDAVVAKGDKLQLLRNDTANSGLHVRLVPKSRAEQELGCKVWVYPAGKLDEAKSLIHYRQCFMERATREEMKLDGLLHVGLGQSREADIRVRFPSGVTRTVKGAKAGTTVTVTE